MTFGSFIRISPEQATPLYRQLAEAIIEAINAGTLKPNDRIPSDRELSDELNVGRMTVRRAMSDLIRDGWLYAEPGKGTFVRGSKMQGHQQIVRGFSQDWQQRGHETHADVLAFQLVPADSQLADNLHIPLYDVVVKLERLRYLDGEPISLETAYLPYARCPGILEHDFRHESLYGVLREKYHHRFAWARQTVEADHPTERECKLMMIPPTTPMLRGTRTVYLPDEQVIEFSVASYRGDRYRYDNILFEHQLAAPGAFEELNDESIKSASDPAELDESE